MREACAGSIISNRAEREGNSMAENGIARKIKEMGSEFRGHAALYRLDPPIKVDEEEAVDDGSTSFAFVIVSAATVPFSGPETYIFPATEDGEIVGWGELRGSYRGGLDHTEALEGAGYTVA